MTLNRLLIFLLLGLCLTANAKGEEAETERLYQKGVLFYQNSQWQEAFDSYQQALMQDPDNPFILYNLGLAAFRLEKYGPSTAYWRKAISISPGLKTAKNALKLVYEKLAVSQHGVETSSWERFRSSFLVYVRKRTFYFLTVLFFFVAGWTWLSFLGKRRKALAEQKPLPQPPYLAVVYTLFFCLLSALLAAKIYDGQTPRGTVIAKEVKAKSGPDEQASDLFDLSEATEVLLRKSQGDWIQISYPDGLAGWIKKDQVFQTSGENL